MQSQGFTLPLNRGHCKGIIRRQRGKNKNSGPTRVSSSADQEGSNSLPFSPPSSALRSHRSTATSAISKPVFIYSGDISSCVKQYSSTARRTAIISPSDDFSRPAPPRKLRINTMANRVFGFILAIRSATWSMTPGLSSRPSSVTIDNFLTRPFPLLIASRSSVSQRNRSKSGAFQITPKFAFW